MTLGRAFLLSLALHAGALLVLVLGRASVDVGGLAQPPVSSLQARIFTYENADLHAASAEPQGSVDFHPVDTGRQPSQSTPPASTQAPAQAPSAAIAKESIPDSSELDASPVVVSSVTLEYPLAANNREGLVTLALVVAADGSVEDVSVVKASPPGFFEAAAIEGFRKARFTPGMLGGVGVKSRLVVEVEFMPTNRGSAVSGQK